MSIFGEIADGIIGSISTGYNIYQDKRNFNYQKDLQQELFKRDDNAIQRRMADLKAAGINPILAGFSGSGNTSAGGYSGVTSFAPTDFKNTEQRQLNKEHTKKIMEEQKYAIESMRQDIRNKKLTNLQAIQDLRTKEVAYNVLKRQYDDMEKNGYYPQSTGGKVVGDIANLIDSIIGQDGISLHPLRTLNNVITENVSPSDVDKIREEVKGIGQKIYDTLYPDTSNKVIKPEKKVKEVHNKESKIVKKAQVNYDKNNIAWTKDINKYNKGLIVKYNSRSNIFYVYDYDNNTVHEFGNRESVNRYILYGRK